MNGIIHKAQIMCLLLVAITAHRSIAQDCLPLSGCDTGQCDSLSCDAAALACNCDGGCDGGPCSCQHQSCCSRPAFTGDWLGLRTCLQESGVTFRGTSTHFGFGVAGGINNPAVPAPFGQGDTFKYTGRGEYDFMFDLEKFGGLPHGQLLVGLQHWYGQYGNVSLNTGGFSPAVFPAALPTAIDDPGSIFLTDFVFTQPLSENLIVFAGKKNVIGGADQDIFAGGDGTDQFMNQSLIANPAFLLGLPYTSFTAGVALPQKWGLISAFVYDPQDRTQDFFNLGDLFSKGVIAGGEVKVKTNFCSKPGEHHVGGIWKHLDLVDLSASPTPPVPAYPYPPAPPGAPTLRDSYTIYYGFDQYLKVYPGERKRVGPVELPRGIGLFGRASISDGNPTPVRYFLSTGIAGDSRAGGDRGDAFGLGWYYVGATDQYGPIASALFAPRDGQGVELYYRFQLTPSVALTPDVQYIRPGISSFTGGDDAFVYGMRLNVNL